MHERKMHKTRDRGNYLTRLENLDTIGTLQGVHKVSLQFQKFITKATERTDERKLLQNYIFKFFFLPHGRR